MKNLTEIFRAVADFFCNYSVNSKTYIVLSKATNYLSHFKNLKKKAKLTLL